MILVTLGTQRFQMNRVVDEIDHLIENKKLRDSEVVLQYGYSKKSKYAKNYQLIDEALFDDLLNKAEFVICHGGTSSIIKALKASKKVIAVPRMSKFKEHVDDHQIEIVQVLYEKGYIEKVENINELGSIIQLLRNKDYVKYESRGQLAKYIVSHVLNI
ncbi:glycosyltransferase [Heyndrickxia faecalis]|uniref:glycosyltransferase n=1 Tax=Heyndrickxia faecalis TaxID=2824910 RepID=UPI003D1B5655